MKKDQAHQVCLQIVQDLCASFVSQKRDEELDKLRAEHDEQAKHTRGLLTIESSNFNQLQQKHDEHLALSAQLQSKLSQIAMNHSEALEQAT
jgi:hypothetical protein